MKGACSSCPSRQIQREESCGNGGAVESVENQKQVSHTSHEPLGNLAKSGRDSHISTAPATRRMEKWKTKSRFSTFPPPRVSLSQKKEKKENPRHGRASPPARGGASRLAEEVRSNCRCSG